MRGNAPPPFAEAREGAECGALPRSRSDHVKARHASPRRLVLERPARAGRAGAGRHAVRMRRLRHVAAGRHGGAAAPPRQGIYRGRRHARRLSAQEYRHIVRIVGNDIPGDKKLVVGLTQVRGIGYNFATAVMDKLGIGADMNVGHLTDGQVKQIEGVISDPLAAGFPAWFLNRRKDIETGGDRHLLTSDIEFTVRNDVERERAAGSWRGQRHMFGLKVRGQRTRTTGRRGGAVGVAKGGKVMPAKGSGSQSK